MRILFIRHGDPDYVKDSLTEKGWREAEALAPYLEKKKIKAFYCSPLGRAKDTISLTLNKKGQQAEIQDFLQEFHTPMKDPGTGRDRLAWDLMPSVWTEDPLLYSYTEWQHSALYGPSPEVGKAVRETWQGLDGILERHGYRREGEIYRVVEPNHDTIAIVCHFGITSIMLGHLLGISPVLFLHTTFIPPTGLTLLASEERESGVARFRLCGLGMTPHLQIAGEPVSASGLFKEVFTDQNERIDVFKEV